MSLFPSVFTKKNTPKASISLEFLDETFRSTKVLESNASKATGSYLTLSSLSSFYETPQKVVLVGDSSVGKTSLIRRFLTDEFTESQTRATILAYSNKKVTVKSASPSLILDSSVLETSQTLQSVVLNIWDPAGSERFRALTSNFFNGAKAVILVLDLTNERSFHNLEFWIESINTTLEDSKHVKCLFGNKSDAPVRAVHQPEISGFCEKWGLCYFEGSAKSGKNVEACFQYVAEELYDTLRSSLSRLSPCMDCEENSKQRKFSKYSRSQESIRLDESQDSRSRSVCGC